MPSLSSDNWKTASSPYINRFVQPDTIIPDLSNPQSWNRYSYVTNRPVNFNDPTGHTMETDSDAGSCDEDCWNDIQDEKELQKERRKKLQEELDAFEPPALATYKLPVGIWWWKTELAPAEYQMFYLMRLRTHDALDTISLIKMMNIMNNADATTEDLYLPYKGFGANMHLDPSDAFHHAYWSALITREFGENFAERFTYAHETRPGSIPEQSFMDMHNNQIGIQIALANPNATDAQLADAILDSMTNGELYVYDDNNEIYHSDQCPDCWWSPK